MKTNAAYTIESQIKLAREIQAKFPHFSEDEAMGMAEFQMKYGSRK